MAVGEGFLFYTV